MGGWRKMLAMPDRRATALGLVAGALFAPTFVRAEEPPPEPAPKPDARPDQILDIGADKNDRMTVPVTVNGKGPFPFVIDTGSNRTVVSDTLAAHLALPAGESLTIRAATGMASTGSVHVAELAVGFRRLTDLHAPVLTQTNLGALGMLGIDAVADQRLVMDFRKKQMTLTKSVRRESDPETIVVAARSRYGQLLLVDSEVEGIPLYVIIDTGSEVTVGNNAMKMYLSRRRAQGMELIAVTGDRQTVDIGFLPELRVGKVIVRNEQVAYADLYVFEQLGLHGKPSMLLGMSTLRQCAKVSIDFPAREVRFLLT
jgi:predicted aspartyl protease